MNKKQQAERKAIAWSTDALIPGFYVWLGNWSFRFAGLKLKRVILERYIVSLEWRSCYLATTFGLRTRDRMTLNRHQIDGLPKILDRTMAAAKFERLLVDAGYSKIGSASAKGN